MTFTQNRGFNIWCPYPEPRAGPLTVSHTIQIKHDLVFNHVEIYSDEVMKLAKQSHTDFYLDINCQEWYNCSYERYMMNIVDELILRSSNGHGILNTEVQTASSNHVSMDLQSGTNTDTKNEQLSIVPPNLGSHFPCDTPTTQVRCDISIPDKQFGFLNHKPPNFEFIGPDSEPVHITTIEQHLQVANVIRHTGVPNYAQARIPIVSGLNVEAWEHALMDYPDNFLIQYIKFGFPLSITSPGDLHVSDVKNNASAVNFPEHIQEYFDKESTLGHVRPSRHSKLTPFSLLPIIILA